MNWEHLRAIVWLRQRLFFNWLRRSGIANTIVTGILMALGLVASAVMFFVALLLGIKLLPRRRPTSCWWFGTSSSVCSCSRGPSAC